MTRSLSPTGIAVADAPAAASDTQRPESNLAVIDVKAAVAVPSLQESARLPAEGVCDQAVGTAAAETKTAASLTTRDQAERAVLRANAEQARRSEACLREFLERLLATIALPYFAWDRDGRIIRWNEALTRASGIPAEQALGRTPRQILCPEAWDALARAHPADFARRDGLCRPEEAILIPGPLTVLPGVTAARLTLLPLYRIPGCLEAIFAFIE